MRRLVLLAVVLLAGCGGASARPELQDTLDELVMTHVAPGVTAYVAGPEGEWSGSAGHADLSTRERMPADAPMRLESVSKLWTATVVAKLAQEGKLRLDDTVGRHLPGVFEPPAASVTIRQLLNHTSGIVDNNDLARDPEDWLALIHDPGLRVELQAMIDRLRANPALDYDDSLEIRTAAALPLIFAPGGEYHYSNIGYKIAGAIAEAASGETLGALYRRVIIEPLGLTSAAYAPHSRIPGEHPLGYAFRNGLWVEATREGSGGLGAEGGIVANARDEARFLQALVRGELVPTKDLFTPSYVEPSYALGTGISTTCAGTAYTHNGGGVAWASSVAVSEDGSRVAVLLVNGRYGDADYAAAVFRLFCDA